MIVYCILTVVVLCTGYQRELTYKRDDHGFSAFGNNDPASSTWYVTPLTCSSAPVTHTWVAACCCCRLTAFVVRCFKQARHMIMIDEDVIELALDFVVSQIRRDGSYNVTSLFTF